MRNAKEMLVITNQSVENYKTLLKECVNNILDLIDSTAEAHAINCKRKVEYRIINKDLEGELKNDLEGVTALAVTKLRDLGYEVDVGSSKGPLDVQGTILVISW